ncbi:hypothetical protein GCM10027277_08030 [Pseudoduganella ginsengisoli]|uniref:Uncharacterized protein n=1 Tax=Pseudoduganella ginsengisoli TaxID=1462440 RepID=A0A6L6Q0A2_9BURK|nr:hypothetical protein [Pseudoduganella ginsengisoli]MTW03257.1 hypothetical protein [Pseudoduganella ginsengisoli]
MSSAALRHTLSALSVAAALAAPASAAVVSYDIGPISYINQLYTMTAPSSYASCKPATTTGTIECYLMESLKRDGIPVNSVTVAPNAAGTAYTVSIDSNDPRAQQYQAAQTTFLDNNHAGQALNGVTACEADQSCWQVQSAQNLKGCPGPWQFWLPLGLPMVSQKAVMMLHYPPYTSFQAYDYLNNATLNRWERMLTTVGVPASQVNLYESIVDIAPIAAPGSGETACLTPGMSEAYFSNASANRNYITPMLTLLANPPVNASKQGTAPVLVFGSEPRQVWQDMYKLKSFNVLDVGTVTMPGDTKPTAYIAANHPIAAVYDTCTSTPNIITMEIQDLTTACFAQAMSADPTANPTAVRDACKAQQSQNQAGICINAKMDMSKYPYWTWDQAKTWCDANNNNPCPSAQAKGAKSAKAGAAKKQ